MKTYYKVTQKFQDGGQITTEITDTRKALRKPSDTFRRTYKTDIYSVWFDAFDKASEYVSKASDRILFA